VWPVAHQLGSAKRHLPREAGEGGWGWVGVRAAAARSADCSMCLQGRTANQLTGGWRRAWTASRGSSRPPAWPAQLSEMPREATCPPRRAKAPRPPGLAWTGPGNTPQHYPAGSSPRPHAALRSTASPATGCHDRSPGPGRGDSPHTPPSDCYLNYAGSPLLLPPRQLRGHVLGCSASSRLPLARGLCPVPGGPALWNPRRFCPGAAWAIGDCCPLPPGAPPRT